MKYAPVYGVVMAGGQGTRFWPLSRQAKPKQFLSLDGRATLLQHTVKRLIPLVGWERLLVVTHRLYADTVRSQLPQLPEKNLLAEPQARNTLPCLLFAAAIIRLRERDAIMLALPADHWVSPVRRMREALRTAARLAWRESALVTLGVAPSRAETGYGYIECGDPLPATSLKTEGYRVRRFREKPDEKTARRFLRTGRFLWNSGMFIWKAETFWQAANEVASGMTAAFERILGVRGRISSRALAELYQDLPSVSVDHGVLEPISLRGVPPLFVLKSPFAWSDIGSWAELGVVAAAESNGNLGQGPVVSYDSANNLVWVSEKKKLVALVGVADTVVVDTPDALMVCRREAAQNIRQVVELLRAKGWTRYL